jgi:medium-chain acyl-[acyl-carrier-protein] hydrolase
LRINSKSIKEGFLMPEKLITYTQKFTVYRTDGDHLGHVKLGALLRYAQQVATAHAEAVGLDDALYRKTHTAYVLAKLALHVTRLPRVDEELTLVTQPERCKRAVNKRITHFYDADGAEVATMDSRWVLIDTEKRMILRKHPEQFNDQWAADVPFELPIKLPRIAPEDCEVLGEQQAVYSRCDMNGHLNNTRYADIVCDAVPWEVWDTAHIRDFTISYHREVPRGESFTLRRARLAEDTFYFEGEREGKSAFEAQLIFKHL